MPNDLLQVEGLRVAYGSLVAVEGLDLAVPADGIVGLLGPNGVGKSTAMRAVAGLLRPQQGRILFAGEDVTGHSCRQRARAGISYIPEGGAVVHALSVRENLVLGGFHLGRRALALELERVFELFPALLPLAKTESWRLSGGEQQMVAVGRALMSRPRLLLMDEPSLGLAPLLVARLFERLAELRRSGSLAIVLVEQNFRLAARVTGYLYFMRKGRIVRAGPTQDIVGSGSQRDLIDTYLGAS